jgi:hypothetical protein
LAPKILIQITGRCVMRYTKFLMVLAVMILSGLLAIQVNAGPKGQGKGKGPKPPAPVTQTGQTTSYVDYDDGYYQMGVICPEPRFTDNEDGTVTDNCTGLMWKEQHLGGMTWYDALESCDSLQFAEYEDWRLPNVRELHTLIDYEWGHVPRPTPFLPHDIDGNPLFNVWVWTSTSQQDPVGAYAIGINGGGDVRGFDKVYDFIVAWPVRDGN